VDGIVDDGDDGGGGGMGSDDMYKGKVKPVLVLLSNSYSDDKISVSYSRPSSCLAYISC